MTVNEFLAMLKEEEIPGDAHIQVAAYKPALCGTIHAEMASCFPAYDSCGNPAVVFRTYKHLKAYDGP